MSDQEKPAEPRDDRVTLPASRTPDALESYSPQILLRQKADDDRRGSERRAYYVGVHIATDAEATFGLSGNISAGGIFVVAEDPPPLGSRVELDFLLENTDTSLVVEGEVRWVRGQWDRQEGHPPGFGVEFDALNPIQREVLDEMLDKLDISSEEDEA
ncbi:hypothetical protein FIV42_20230 [Persicimonas caeni]|uniref:PilZ domain-containing protein n=1 Tax=Persicimonas caeni TaxID=2292766 RepID=A0A4Y6PXD1_PERCE|nr:PilZ domain-containing protein [Persicimonas caeni]QDG52988.1 hypothetical protein FIV42_20230 [Persicimonas caeni]QED34210.1 hypothetical protein FRD00_20225 [Persicimonas caeni]